MMDNLLLGLCGTPSLSGKGMLAIPDVPGTGPDLDAAQLEPWITGVWSERL
jgi:hypothetical protein